MALDTARPPELQLEGAVIRTSYGTGGRVIAVRGPYPPNHDSPRPEIHGWTIVYEEPSDGKPSWINEVYVIDGRIYAYPWRDEISVVEPARMQQLALF